MALNTATQARSKFWSEFLWTAWTASEVAWLVFQRPLTVESHNSATGEIFL
jgi:hypothetical protein